MITPVRFEVACVAWDCQPDRYAYAPVVSKPLAVEARSVREAGKKAHDAGWRRAPGRGNHWWCPRHAAIASARNGHE